MTRPAITTVRTVVARIEDDGADIKVYTLVDPDRWELPPFRAGAHIDLYLPGNLVRTYSLCNDPADSSRYVIAVKREAAGRGGSQRLHDEVNVGDEIGVSLPRGGLALDADTHFVFVAGGIGLTPFLSATARLSREQRRTFELHVVHRGDAAPLSGLLAPMLPDGQVVLHPTSAGARPDIAALIGAPRPGVQIACCGPDGMIAAFEAAAAGWPPAQVHVERFVPPPLPVDPDTRPYTLELARSHPQIAVGQGQTMLSALLELGIDIPASCCGGICGSCKVNWLEGQPIHRDRALSPGERERSLLVCVAASASDRLVLDL